MTGLLDDEVMTGLLDDEVNPFVKVETPYTEQPSRNHLESFILTCDEAELKEAIHSARSAGQEYAVVRGTIPEYLRLSLEEEGYYYYASSLDDEKVIELKPGAVKALAIPEFRTARATYLKRILDKHPAEYKVVSDMMWRSYNASDKKCIIPFYLSKAVSLHYNYLDPLPSLETCETTLHLGGLL